MRQTPAIVLVALLATGCAATDNDWGGTIADSAGVAMVSNPEAGTWSLRPEPTLAVDLDIGTAEGEPAYQFGQVIGVDVNAQGEILVLDQQAAQVRVFDPQGRHLRSVGKPGGGPGELSMATMGVFAGDSGRLYVADIMRQRLVEFAADGTEAASYDMPMQNGMPVRWQPIAPGRMAVQVRRLAFPGMPASDSGPKPDLVMLRDLRSGVTDTLLTLAAGNTIQFGSGGPRIRLFESEPIWLVLPDGSLLSARNDDYRLELRAADGTLRRVITRPFTRRPVTEADREAFRGMMRDAMKNSPAPPAMIEQFISGMQFADNYPAFSNVVTGPASTIWVQRVRTAEDAAAAGGTFNPQDMGSPEWDVFDEEGRLLGTARMPDRFQPGRAAGDAWYGVQRDELDVQHVVRVRVTGM